MHLNRDTAGFFIFGDVMSTPNPLLGRDLGGAICKHFGLSVDQVHSEYSLNTEPGGTFSVSLTVSLTAEDVAGIAQKAGAKNSSALGYLTGWALVGESGPELIKYTCPINKGEALKSVSVTPVGGGPGGSATSVDAKPDSRLDEVIDLLRRILGRMDAPIPTVNVVAGE